MQLKDSHERYGAVSRFLHWSMALAVFWQLTSAMAHYFFEDTAFEAFMWPTHKPLGFALIILAILRLVWALLNLSQRPPQVDRWAKLGHVVLYLLLVVVPLLGLLRQYAFGRGFSPFGLPIFQASEDGGPDWMIDIGNALHGELGWLLLATIVGHIAFVIWHRRSSKHEDVLPRMAGK